MIELGSFTFITILCVLILGTIMAIQYYGKQFEYSIQKDNKKLEIELKKPRYQIVFTTILNPDKKEFISGFGPEHLYFPGSEWNRIITSQTVATNHMRQCFERGYFTNDSSVSFPVCNINTVQVVEVK